MRTAERPSKVFSPETLLLILSLLAGCRAAVPETVEAFGYRDPALPESEHRAILRALDDLAGRSVHGRLKAEHYFNTMGIALGSRLVPYWEQLLDDDKQETRLAVTHLIIKFCGPRSAPLLVEFLESENEAVRRDASAKLGLVTGREFEFDYSASPAERAEAVSRIRKTLELRGL